MPTKHTFKCKPIKELVSDYLKEAVVSVDPFAGNSNLATHTNDLSLGTSAQDHLEAHEYLAKLNHAGVQADLILFDPPYSLRQIKDAYNGVGKNISGLEGGWVKEKELANKLLKIGGYAICFGWNSIGMGKKRLYRLERVLLVSHGRLHNDTICTVEIKVAEQKKFLNLAGGFENIKTKGEAND
ncbi:hypothetical protein LCGC14_0686760 [marine sediment metagenome]|uniref:DNA methylase N-4/N-6 domain-containing protein n=1 Tax=marine sediment metagenome TaxID=412755 RepID=A0A0F9QRI8_9ZZZZ